MAFITYRTSRGKKYWSIVESRRINNKPKHIILEYLGTANSLLNKLRKEEKIIVNSYSHGDTSVLINVASELNIMDIINNHVHSNHDGSKPTREGLSVGASIVLAAIGRACHPTSKMGWYDWCRNTSLEYCLKTSLSGLDSQHFWDQMDRIPVEKISSIEEEIVKNIIAQNNIKLDLLLYDPTNFFTFINSQNDHCDIPQRGKNKQKRLDLRQIGMALAVTKDEQIPLFHKTYQGNKNDITSFMEVFKDLSNRIKSISRELEDITMVFDKGNNSKDNFKLIDKEKKLYYVGGLVSSYFKEMIKEANNNFTVAKIDNKEIPVYRIKQKIWGYERTCLVTISEQLREGQIQGIHQHLEKKHKELESFKRQLENPKSRKKYKKEEIKTQLRKIIRGQFIEEILKYDLIELKENKFSFTYYIDEDSFDKLKDEVLGRKILVTNRHNWSNEEIMLAYRGQAKVEYAFRNLKNPYHLAVRPQYHWTDQKIEVHILICIIGYMLTQVAYTRARKKAGYRRNINNFLNDLNRIRLACVLRKKDTKVQYQLEKIPDDLIKVADILKITDTNIRPKEALL